MPWTFILVPVELAPSPSWMQVSSLLFCMSSEQISKRSSLPLAPLGRALPPPPMWQAGVRRPCRRGTASGSSRTRRTASCTA
eukprot:7110077-Alexandrium_andersonii.AAC.1